MADAVLSVSGLKKVYPIRVNGRSLYREKRLLRAVDGVTFSIGRGDSLGLVGESGCGKSTLARLVMKLESATEGTVCYGETDVTRYTPRQMRPLRHCVQMIFQDPYASLNPRKTVFESIAAPLSAMRLSPPAEHPARVREMLELVGLDDSFLEKYPHQMSGGQRQRVAIARAMISSPSLVVCDEPVSALDLSVRGQILNLMKRLQQERGVSYLFISHDFGTVRYLCNRVAVMYLGSIVEEGAKADIFERPVHPYTRALLSAEPKPELLSGPRDNFLLRGEAASAAYTPAGCAFHTRCPYATQGCAKGAYPLRPLLRTDGDTHKSACPRYKKNC